jgi:hypothetical protein
MAARAGTPAEHWALEEYFLTLARKYTAEANEPWRWRIAAP